MARQVQVLQIEPADALRFRGPFTDVVTSELTLRNPSDQKVAFKVKTTAPRRYCVRPNSGILNENEAMTVSVMLQPFDYDPSERTKHKFMIQATYVPAGQTEADAIWRDANPEHLMDTKLKVFFDSERESVAVVQESVEVAASEPVSKTIGSTISEEEFHRVKEENSRLSAETATLKEEAQRLRKLAMNDTVSSGASQKAMPSGIALLFIEKKNILLIILLFIIAFAAGLFLSNTVMPLTPPKQI